MNANRILLKTYSPTLKKEMSLAIYGKRKALPVLVFPSQDGKSTDYENFHMVDTLSDYIKRGLIQLFCVDSHDVYSFSDLKGDPEKRIQNQEKYYQYIIQEVLPLIRQYNRSNARIFLTGNSMGGYHASNFFFRRPDLFEGFLSLSGIFDASLLMNGYMSELVYQNSPIHCLRGMKEDHPYLPIYRDRSIFLCVGRGKYEEEGLLTQPILEKLLREKNIPCFSDYWGYDVDHDWSWWQKQITYLLPKALLEIQKHYPKILKDL
jgi:esterase/lipase superfamily enzyme